MLMCNIKSFRDTKIEETPWSTKIRN